MFTHSMTILNKIKYMQMHILILDTLKIMCAKNLSHIFMLTYCTSLLFQSFDAVIISRFCSGHVTICTNHVKLHIFNYFFHICRKSLKHQSVSFTVLRSLLWPVGLNGLNGKRCTSVTVIAHVFWQFMNEPPLSKHATLYCVVDAKLKHTALFVIVIVY